MREMGNHLAEGNLSCIQIRFAFDGSATTMFAEFHPTRPEPLPGGIIYLFHYAKMYELTPIFKSRIITGVRFKQTN